MNQQTPQPLLRPEEVVYKYADMVYRLAYARVQSATAADDVMQDVFLRYLSHKGRFVDEEHLKAWLLRATINRSKSLLTCAWRRKVVPLTDTLTTQLQEKSEVYWAVMQLPPKARTVVHLYYYEDYPVREIARLLGHSESAVKSQLHRARALLREKLRDDCADL